MKSLFTNLYSLISNAINWIKNNRFEAFFLILILAVGAFMRLYRISEYMTFLGDEGRDVIIVRRLLVDFDPILIGPRTSIGDMYLGPLYYYLMAPALLFANFNPVGAAAMVALFGIATIFFIWYTAREWFSSEKGSGKVGAFIAAGLYAISPTVINYSKSSWNPNIMPFFAILTIFSVWKWWQEQNYRWFIVTGISMAFVLQSHYLGLLLIPTICFFCLITILNRSRQRLSIEAQRSHVLNFLKQVVIGTFIFAVLMSPLVMFDSRHGWRNFASIKKFFTERQTTVSARPWTAFPKLPEVIDETNASLLGAKNEDLTWLYTNISILLIIWIFYEIVFANNKIKTKNWPPYLWRKINQKPLAPFILLMAWLFIAYLGLGLYKQHIYDHYFGFFFPAPFLLVGGITQYIFREYSFWWKVGLVVFFIYAVFINLAESPLRQSPNRQMQRTIEVAEKIRDEAMNEKFNLAVIAERNYEDAYQYFLEKWEIKVIDIDPLRAEETITDQLFVVCELAVKQNCDPTHNPKAEIANFGWSKIDGVWEVAGLNLYKLTHVTN